MNFLRRPALLFSRWLDDVSSAITSMGDMFRPRGKFQITEQADSAFLVQALRRRSTLSTLGPPIRFVGARFVENDGVRVLSRLEGGQIEIVLARHRFVFRPLELPQQASDFLDAIVRSQIDRLTPWDPSEAAFGCGSPTETSNGRLGVVVAATARSSVTPFVRALEALKSSAIVVSAASDDAADNAQRRTIVYSERTGRELSTRRVRQFLVAPLAIAGLSAVAAFAAWVVVGASLDASRLQIARQMAERRVALLSGRPGVVEEAAAKLAKKKQDSPATVIVLDSLSQILPDDTYLTELHVADGKLEMTGVTHQAASLIPIIEQTEQFKNATFFAPTTRAPTETGEQFHIQAQILPYFPAP